MTTGIDYTEDGRAQSPAGGQGGIQRLQMSEADTAAGQRTEGRGFQSSVCVGGRLVTRCRLEPQWTDLPGNHWSQGGFAAAEDTCFSLPTPPSIHPSVPPILQSGKSNRQGSDPLIQNRVEKGQETDPGARARACTAVSPQSHSHSARILHTSILQPKVIVSCSKVSANGIYSDYTDVTLSNNSLSR